MAGIGLGIGLLPLSACTEFPDLDRAVPASERNGPYPKLVPVEGLLAQTEDPRIAEDEDDALAARAAALRARAARLKAY
jgi:hypothetical protein